jgi:hypothetical protein
MKREIYINESTIFKDEDTEERNIHIGLDLWIKAGTPILALSKGLHSFNFNAGFEIMVQLLYWSRSKTKLLYFIRPPIFR